MLFTTGPDGLRRTAYDIHSKTAILEQEIKQLGYKQLNKNYFDTIKISLPNDITEDQIRSIALRDKVNFRYFGDGHIGVSIDELTSIDDLNLIVGISCHGSRCSA